MTRTTSSARSSVIAVILLLIPRDPTGPDLWLIVASSAAEPSSRRPASGAAA